MSNTIDQLIKEVEDHFLRTNANLLALTKNGATDTVKRMFSALALDQDARDAMKFLGDPEAIEQKNVYARNLARQEFRNELYKRFCAAFLRIQHNYVVEFVSKLTDEALDELEKIEIVAGVRIPAPPPPPQKSAQELLDDEIKHDWVYLGADKLRKKCNANPAYKKRFDELIATDALQSSCTALHDGGAEFRQ
jgi:hypothetical protein